MKKQKDAEMFTSFYLKPEDIRGGEDFERTVKEEIIKFPILLYIPQNSDKLEIIR